MYQAFSKKGTLFKGGHIQGGTLFKEIRYKIINHQKIMTVADETASPSLSPTLLGFTALICLFGLITNSYAANYMTNNFDLSKMTYKILLWSCLIHVIGCVVMLITALYLWAEGTSEFICIVFQISLLCPIFTVQSFMFEMSILRCIISCSKKSAEDLNNFQKGLVAFMTPLPFAYIGTMSIYRLANDKSLGYAHLVSIFIIFTT
jgi:hypothetical protein